MRHLSFATTEKFYFEVERGRANRVVLIQEVTQLLLLGAEIVG